MAEKRIAISKKLRFEVFKRDSFTCQYCGRMAPDVILEVDHIDPVKRGGKNDILNLITSCKDCNRGKGARVLDDNQVLKAQQEQLKELSEKREQMKEMLRWREELKSFNDEQVDEVTKIIEKLTDFSASDHGRMMIKKWIDRFGLEIVMSATETSFTSYYLCYAIKSDSDWEKAFNKIGGICYNIKTSGTDPLANRKAYIFGIMRNRFPIYDNKRVWSMLNGLVIDDNSADHITKHAKYSKNWTKFWYNVNDDFGGGW